MTNDLRQKLSIPSDRLDAINAVLLNPDTRLIKDFLAIVSKYGSPEEINQKAAQAGQLDVLLEKVETIKPEYLENLSWLGRQERQ